MPLDSLGTFGVGECFCLARREGLNASPGPPAGYGTARNAAVPQPGRLKAEVQIRPRQMTPHRPRAEQSHALELRLRRQHLH
jgi:hypothetical protein